MQPADQRLFLGRIPGHETFFFVFHGLSIYHQGVYDKGSDCIALYSAIMPLSPAFRHRDTRNTAPGAKIQGKQPDRLLQAERSF
uniref:Uncharacterized protein n=1 Tax=Faecalibaculum rodentium TaxID=1702221 RepID=A0A140DYE0_9FIRM|nr:hypothetical protein AALO17_25330 [Faecalibaculum rodentium]